MAYGRSLILVDSVYNQQVDVTLQLADNLFLPSLEICILIEGNNLNHTGRC